VEAVTPKETPTPAHRKHGEIDSAMRENTKLPHRNRLESGQTVSVNSDLGDEYGATADEAFSKIETAIEAWVKKQTRSD
jgi:hypothetical protein